MSGRSFHRTPFRTHSPFTQLEVLVGPELETRVRSPRTHDHAEKRDNISPTWGESGIAKARERGHEAERSRVFLTGIPVASSERAVCIAGWAGIRDVSFEPVMLSGSGRRRLRKLMHVPSIARNPERISETGWPYRRQSTGDRPRCQESGCSRRFRGNRPRSGASWRPFRSRSPRLVAALTPTVAEDLSFEDLFR